MNKKWWSIFSIVPFFISLMVLLGWVIKAPSLIELGYGFYPIRFNAALGICLSSIAFFFATQNKFRTWQIFLGSIVLIIGTVTALEYLTTLSLSLDQFFLIDWFAKEGSITPGRMGSNTAIVLAGMGFILIVLPFAKNKAAGIFIDISLFLISLLVALAFTGYIFNLKFLYDIWYTSNPMSFFSSICLLSLCIGLWGLWHNYPNSKAIYHGSEDYKILLLSGGVLVVIAFVITITIINLIKDEAMSAITPDDIRVIIFIFIFSLAIGLALLYFQVLPLLRRVMNAEKELLRSNKRLRNSEERYALAIRASNAGLWDWNITTGEVFYSPYFRALLGFTESDFPNNLKSFATNIHPDDINRLQTALENHLINHEHYEIELRIKRKSGDYHWYKAVGQAMWDVAGNPVRMAGSIADITDTKRNERRLSAQYEITKLLANARDVNEVGNKILKILCENMEWDVGALWQIDPTKKIIYSTHLVTMNGDFDSLIKILNQTKLQKGMSAPGRVCETGKPLWINDITDNKNFPGSKEALQAGLHSLFCFPITIGNKILGCLEFYSREQDAPEESLLKIMATLVTQLAQFMERSLHQDEVRETMTRDLAECKKIEKLKNEFVSVVSHELRTPLTSIRGSIALILGGTVGGFSDKAKMLLQIANNNCEKLLLLINDILDIEKIESGKMTFHFKNAQIDKIIKEAITNNKPYTDRLEVTVIVKNNLPNTLLYTDADRVLQVLANLISNAAKFSPPESVIEISAQESAEEVVIYIKDYGIGISEKFRENVFTKFSQADSSSTREKGGTGLGLSISKAIIESLGGKIGFESAENKGTTFYFSLPKHHAEENIPKEFKSDYKTEDTLLICEDDESQSRFLTVMLQSAGFHVDVAENVKEAKQLLAEKEYGMLLLDLILPDQDGIGFIKELRSNLATQNLPIIVMSIISDTGKTLLEKDDYTIVDWLNKPIDFQKLLRSIEVMKHYSKHH